MRGQKGITLVALIITIIVLLILAVVSIGAISDSRIINHSQNAANEWVDARADEEDKIKDAEDKMDEWVSAAKATN